MATVSFRRINKRFGENHVLRDIELEIADGEFLVLVGPSGCGKSTLLRMLAGLEEAGDGEILIGERVVNQLAPREREIAMVFQDYALYPHMTVEENMSFGLRLRKFPKAEIAQRVREAAGILQIVPLLGRTPRQLSGGQRQRVAIGRAIVRKPKVFLFDEPLSNLDAKLREEMRVEIAKLHQQIASTVVYVTHDQVEAMTLARRIAVMNGGQIRQIGAPEEVFLRPRDKFVAGFIGSPTMNFIEGFLERGGAGALFKNDVMSVALSAAPPEGSPREVVLGVRPEDVFVNRQAGPGVSGEISAVVEVVEHLGNRKNFHLKAGDRRLLAQAPAFVAAKAGDLVGVRLALDALHLFDKATELRLG